MTSQDIPDPENSGRDQGRDQAGRFAKGRSGNTAGKPRGTRDRATIAAETLLAGEAEALTRKAVELAKAGDTVALRLCLDRIMPVRKARVRFDLPELRNVGDLPQSFAAIVQLVANGHLAPSEGSRSHKKFYLPEMNGSGENQVIIFPNGLISIRAAKAAEIPPGEKRDSGVGEMTAQAVDRLAPF